MLLDAAHIKYWLAAGRGGFGLSGFECPRSSFYCQVYTTPPVDVEQTRYMRVKTSPIPIKPSYFATVKSNNYLPNALALMDAQRDGCDQVPHAVHALHVRPSALSGPQLVRQFSAALCVCCHTCPAPHCSQAQAVLACNQCLRTAPS